MSRNAKSRRSRKPKPKTIPAARSSNIRTTNPLQRLELSHREYIMDLSTDSNGLCSHSLEVNPGIQETFPWLADISPSFEKYRFKRLAFRYVPSVATSTSGKISISPDYDAADDNTNLTKRELLQFQDTVNATVWSPVTMRCTGKYLAGLRFTRTAPLASNLDIKTYDVAKLEVRASSTANHMLGELYVDYTVVLEIPQRSYDPTGVTKIATSNPNISQPFSDTSQSDGLAVATVVAGSTDVNSDTGTSAKISPGRYFVNLVADGSGVTGIDNPTVSNGTWTNIQNAFTSVYANRTGLMDIFDGGGHLNWTGITGSASLYEIIVSNLPKGDYSL